MPATIPDSEVKTHSFWCRCRGCMSNPRSGHLKRQYLKSRREAADTARRNAQRRASAGVVSSSD
jgi:hypothetical protein